MSATHYKSVFLVLCLSLASYLAQAQEVIPDEVIIDYSCLNKTLREVLFDISEEANTTIAFQEEIMPGDSIINFSVKKQEVGVVLDYLLERHHVKYRIVGSQIVLFKDQFYKSDDKITISGYLRDLESGESLISANIYLYDKTTGTISNDYGFYSFTVPKGVQRIYYSYLGYNMAIKELSLYQDTIVDVELDPRIQLNEIVITEKRIVPVPEPERAGVEILPLERLNSFLPVGGEPDVMRLAYTLPGVTSGADGFGGMSVRGGSTNQNLILFDGIPVYNADHLFGLFSIFNSNVIKNAKLYKGAFPSHYSGRLSSVLDIRTREGNNQKFGGDVSVGLLTGKVSLEGPIQKGRSSFLFSARRTTVDPWLNSLNDLLNTNPLVERSTAIRFYDLNGKLNFSIGKSSKLFLSYYQGSDNFDNSSITDNETRTVRDIDELSWDSGNTLMSLRWTSKLSSKSFLNISLYSSEHQFNSFDHDRVEVFNDQALTSAVYDAGYYRTNINDKGLKIDVDFIPSPRHVFKLGAGYIKHTFSPQFIFSDQTDNIVEMRDAITSSDLENVIDDFSLEADELEFYIEDEIRLGEHTSLNLGVNQLVVSSGKTYYITQPRMLFRTGTAKYNLKLSYGMMGQFLHSLSNTGLGVPTDIWLPSTEILAPERSWTASIGNFYSFNSRSTVGLEFFYKQLDNVTRYGTGVLRVSQNSGWENRIPVGQGESYGSEFSLRCDILKKTRLNLGYTLSWSFRQYDAIQAEKFRFRYDRRHVINASLTHKFNENIEFSSNFEYGSGTPITIPSRVSYNYTDEDRNLTRVRVLDQINNAELPAYHRLDIGFNFYNKYKWGRSKLTLGVYNVYNKVNPLYIDEIVNTDFSIRYEQFYLFKILPTFSYNLTF